MNNSDRSCIVILFALVFISASSRLQAQQNGNASQKATDVIQKTSLALSSLSQVSYHYRRELSYASEDYHNVLEGEVAIEFDPTQQPVGAVYQARNASGFDVFNGSEILHGNTATHTMQMDPVRSANDLDHISFLYNSMLTLRLALPALLADPNVEKSIASQTDSTIQLNLRIPRATLNATGTLSPMTLPRDTTYGITVDCKTFIPLEVRQTNSQNSDFMLVQFSSVNTKAAKLPADSWFYSSYKDYRLVQPGNGKKLLAVDSIAPQWTLPLANGKGKTISLTQVLADSKNKLVLLELWISHCGPSIEAVPRLNAIASRFGSSGLAILAVNPDDADSTIQTFVNNNAPHFALLSEGQKVAEEYGVISYPTIFLIDAQGKIIYAGPFEENAVTAVISARLQS